MQIGAAISTQPAAQEGANVDGGCVLAKALDQCGRIEHMLMLAAPADGHQNQLRAHELSQGLAVIAIVGAHS